MSISLPKILPLMAAAAMSLVTLSATVQPVYAAAGPDYRLTAAKPLSGTQVAADVLWRCDSTGCTTARANGRPAIVCAQVAREFGRLDSFSYRDAAFDAAALEKCNSKAR